MSHKYNGTLNLNCPVRNHSSKTTASVWQDMAEVPLHYKISPLPCPSAFGTMFPNCMSMFFYVVLDILSHLLEISLSGIAVFPIVFPCVPERPGMPCPGEDSK